MPAPHEADTPPKPEDDPAWRQLLARMHGRRRDDIEGMIKYVVHRHFGMFAKFRYIDRDDLAQDMLLELRKAIPNYDPSRPLEGFAYKVLVCRLRNWLRTYKRRRKWDRRYARPEEDLVIIPGKPRLPGESRVTLTGEEMRAPADFQDEFREDLDAEIVGGDGQPSLAEWLENVYLAAIPMTRDVSRQGRSYEPAQQVAVSLLAKKLKMSVRGTRGQFEDRADLRNAVEFIFVPSTMWFCRALKVPMHSN